MTKSLAPTSYIGMVEVLQKQKKTPKTGWLLESFKIKNSWTQLVL